MCCRGHWLITGYQFQGISHYDLTMLLVPIMLIIVLQVPTLVNTMATEAVIALTITVTTATDNINTTQKMDQGNMMNMPAS